MRLKIQLFLCSLLVVGSFLGLEVLWSFLSLRLDKPSPLSRMRKFLQFKIMFSGTGVKMVEE